jgi:anti-sigma B factor antagonist
MLLPEIEPFSCEVQTEGAVARVVPSGELDLVTSPEVQRRLVELRTAGCERIVLDLGNVSFLDSTALHLLARWSEGSRADAFDFAVVPGSPHHRRVFELTGLAAQLRYADASAPRRS